MRGFGGRSYRHFGGVFGGSNSGGLMRFCWNFRGLQVVETLALFGVDFGGFDMGSGSCAMGG